METYKKVVSAIVEYLIVGLVLYYVYNNIALEFNLPNFNYLTCCGAYFLLKKFF